MQSRPHQAQGVTRGQAPLQTSADVELRALVRAPMFAPRAIRAAVVPRARAFRVLAFRWTRPQPHVRPRSTPRGSRAQILVPAPNAHPDTTHPRRVPTIPIHLRLRSDDDAGASPRGPGSTIHAAGAIPESRLRAQPGLCLLPS